MQGFVCGMWTVEVEGGGFGEKRCGLYCITDSFIQNLSNITIDSEADYGKFEIQPP